MTDTPKYQLITGVEDKPRKVVIYGTPCIGKSSFAAQFPDPIFIQTENAGGLIEAPRLPECKELRDIFDQLNAILEGEMGTFKTVILDGVKKTEALMSNYVCGKLGLQGLGDDADYGTSPSYSEAIGLWYKLTDKLDEVVEADMNVVLVSHETQRNVKDPRVDEYETTTLDLGKWGKYDPTKILVCWADCVFYLAHKLVTKKADTGIGGKRTTAMGTGERIIYAEERPAYLAKNRFDMPPELPFNKGEGYNVVKEYLTVQKD